MVSGGVTEGLAIDLVSIADDVPAEAKAKIDTMKAGLKDGSFSIWKGPLMGSDGKEVLAADAVADDAFLGGVKFYVKGVEGKVPDSAPCRAWRDPLRGRHWQAGGAGPAAPGLSLPSSS